MQNINNGLPTISKKIRPASSYHGGKRGSESWVFLLDMDSEKRKITGVIFYDTWRIPAEMLDAERFGELVKDFLLWAWDGEEPTKLGETQKMFFNIAKKQAKTDFEKYDAIVEKRREAGKKHTGKINQRNFKTIFFINTKSSFHEENILENFLTCNE